MSAKIAITRTDCTPDEIRQLASNCNNGSQARRLLAIALAMDGDMQRQEIAWLFGTDLQTLCDWVQVQPGGSGRAQGQEASGATDAA